MLVLLLVLLQSPVHEQYNCRGYALEGPYELTLDIEKRKDNYYLTWHDTMVQSQGFGVLVGDTLSVIYKTIIGELGVINYKVSAGRLEGVWSVGDEVIYRETCTLGIPGNV